MITVAPEQLAVLRERRDWLDARIAAKRSIGWETEWDEREHAALCWAVAKLTPARALSEPDGA